MPPRLSSCLFALALLCFLGTSAHAAGPQNAWRQAQSCVGHGLVLHEKTAALPDGESTAACEQHTCRQAGDVTVCRCIPKPEEDPDDGGARYRFYRGGQLLGSYNVPGWLMVEERFHLYTGRLGGPRSPAQLALLTMTNESQGIGVRSWDLAVFPLADLSRTPQRLTLGEAGSRGALLRLPGLRGCRALDVQFSGPTEPWQGQHNAFVGHWYRLTASGWAQDLSLPTLYRRYSFRFERERGATQDDAEVPIRWFRRQGRALPPQAVKQD